MYSNYVALSKDSHRNLRVTAGISIKHLSEMNLIPVSISEFEKASTSLPIAFVKSSETGDFESVVVTGIEQGENLWIENNRWQSEFVPQVIQRLPFGLMIDENDHEQLLVAINEMSEFVNQNKGTPLFDENGEESDYLQKRSQQLVQYHENSMHTKIFIEFLNQHLLLEQTNLTLNVNQQKVTLNGLYIVNKERLHHLTNENFLTLREKNYLSAIYVHLASVYQFQILAKKKTEQKAV